MNPDSKDTKTAEERAKEIFRDSKYTVSQSTTSVDGVWDMVVQLMELLEKATAKALIAHAKSERRKALSDCIETIKNLEIGDQDDMYNTALCDCVVAIEQPGDHK